MTLNDRPLGPLVAVFFLTAGCVGMVAVGVFAAFHQGRLTQAELFGGVIALVVAAVAWAWLHGQKRQRRQP